MRGVAIDKFERIVTQFAQIIPDRFVRAMDGGIQCRIPHVDPILFARFVTTLDLCVLLGNLLDNAIEACGKLEKEKRRIQLSIKLVKNQLFIRTENPFEGKLKWQGSRLLTQKTDENNHGIGLENVKRVVEKYHGTLEMNAEDQIFRTKILRYLG